MKISSCKYGRSVNNNRLAKLRFKKIINITCDY